MNLITAEIIVTITSFLTGIGIRVTMQPITPPAFLPGLQLKNGGLIIDTKQLLYPGDILHEAGHLATMPPHIRETMNDTLENNDLNQGGEMMDIAWSYAAALHLGLSPGVVFHANGYKGGHQSIIENFSAGRYMGLPLLQWAGMAYGEQRARELDMPAYPLMLKWLRED